MHKSSHNLITSKCWRFYWCLRVA